MGKKPKRPHNTAPATGLDAQLASFGLSLFDVSGDGNCLFRALSHQMESTQSNHLKFRTQIVSHMRSHNDLYAPFLDEDESLDQRLRRMEKQGVYGDNIEIVAFSRAFKVGVVIHQEGQPVWVVDACSEDGDVAALDRRIVHLVYHSWEHYSSVVPAPASSASTATAVKFTSSKKNASKQPPKDATTSSVSINEKIVLNSIPKHLDADITTVRRLLKEYKQDIGKVVEAFVAQVYAFDGEEEEEGCDPAELTQTGDSTTIGPSVLDNDLHALDEKPEPPASTKVEPSKPLAWTPTPKSKKPSAKDVKREKKKLQKENALAKKRNGPTKSAEEVSVPISKNHTTMHSISALTDGLKATFI
ncbi:OTU domain-containing protein 3 [Podochytrium sp. JEL0797]|nr:OTU domain-containing protein 3 [Podochytrium sp. JEL0797]